MRPSGQIKERVRTHLERHQHATDKQVGKFIGMSPVTAYKYLSELCDEGVAHRTREYNPRGTWLVTFNFGPAPADRFDVRATVRTWAPMRIIDPWMLPREFFQGAQL